MGKRKLTYQEVKEYIEKENYILVSNEYVNSKTKLKVKCPDGHLYEVKFSNFKTGYRCPYCYGNKAFEYKYVKEYIEKENYVLKSKEYINTDTNLDLICTKGHHYSATFYNFKNRKQRCPYCCLTKKYTYKEVEEYIKLYGYKLLSDSYITSKNKILIQCSKGHKYLATFNNFVKGSRCPYCNGKIKHDYKYIKEEISQRGYVLLSTEYINTSSKLSIKCEKNHIFEMNWNNFQQGQSCPYCHEKSKGELTIEETLKTLNIKYECQKCFENCRDIKLLPFDFYIPKYNLIVEYDGEQHFNIKHAFRDKNSFWITVYHDAIKNSYCEDNNINILRIPYWEIKNIKTIIENKLSIL